MPAPTCISSLLSRSITPHRGLLTLLVPLCWSGAGFAQPVPLVPPVSASAPLLKEVIVSGTRSERLADELAQTTLTLSSQDLEDAQVQDIRDAARELPNVSVKRAPARFVVTGRGNATGVDDNAGFSIRGLGGNRVLMLVDGVRLPRSYINGSNAFSRDTVSIGLLKRIEVLYGPSSVMYGSDGLAGLVNFITLQPSDYLNAADGTLKNLGGKAWAGYSGDDQGVSVGGTLAMRSNETSEWSLTGTSGRAKGLFNMGGDDSANVDRTTPNPQNNGRDSVLGKWVVHPTADQHHELTLELVRKTADVDLLSSRAKPPLAASSVVDESATSSLDRKRLAWTGLFQTRSAWADDLQAQLAWQDSAAREAGHTLRKDGGMRLRDINYQERSLQTGVKLSKAATLAPEWSQLITYGVDLTSTDVKNIADGSDPATVTPQFTLRKYFPDTRDTSLGLYLQDEFVSDRWTLTPAIRFDRFSLDVLSQDGYYPGLATAPGVSKSGSATSPKLSVLYKPTPHWGVFGSIATGFRAPEGQQVNSVYESPGGPPAKLLPNPDLKPEESRNLEFGARYSSDRLQVSASWFIGKFTNLIVEKSLLGTVAGVQQFQTINVDQATISGFEVRGSVLWGNAWGGAWSTPFSYGQARGTNDVTGLPLNAVDPAKFNAGIQYASGDWDVQLAAQVVDEKRLSELDSLFIPKSTTQHQFVTPAYVSLDLAGQVRVQKNARVHWAIRNLTDRKYWNWSDVQGLAYDATPVVVDAYTQPGRHVNISLVVDF